MRYFFSNLSVTIKEWFQEFLEISLKKKIIVLVSILLVIALIITGVAIHKSRQKLNAKPDEVAALYAQNIAERNYFKAFDYTIIGKDGVEKYLDKNYLSDYKSKSELTEKEHYDAINVCETLAKQMNSFMTTYGIGDYDNFFAAFVKTAETIIVSYMPDVEPSDKLIIECIKYSLEKYQTEYNDELNVQYNNNYTIELSEPEILEYSDDEVELYIQNKSELANTVFEKSGLKPNKIKAVKRYDYNIIINDEVIRSVRVYAVKIGGYWYVDTTALVY